ncbi:MAG: hypothetical protein K0S80_4289 [Neobacillus sp.]|nr:hypothetical protein [Neobacillus sp.]
MALIADVFDVTLVDVATNDVIATTTLQEANIEVAVSENEVRAGKGNVLIATLKVSRDITISLTDAEFKYDWLAKQLGQDVKTGAGIAFAAPKWYTVVDDAGSLSITLDKTPKSLGSIAIYDKEGKKLTGFTLSGSEVTITAGAVAGDEVEVRSFQYDTPAETQTIEFDSKVFAKGVKAILETVEIDGDETITHVLQYQFDSAVPDGNFSVSTASERNAATQSFNLKVLKPKTSTVVGRLLRFPYTAE